MKEAEAKPFGGFRVSDPTRKFEVTGHSLQLYRHFSRRSLLSEGKPEFSSSIHGQAVTDHEHVCVFGTNNRSQIFHLTINSDLNIKSSWETIKGVDLLVDKLTDPEQRRIRDIQHQIFDKAPPTATLFNEGRHWSLECEVPLHVLEQLSVDMVARCVKSVRFQIEWPFGFVDKLSYAWGFFEGGKLQGHISSFSWSLLTEIAVEPKT